MLYTSSSMNTKLVQLISLLHQAASNPTAHNEAQTNYYCTGTGKEPLYSDACGTAQCVAGAMLLQDAMQIDASITLSIMTQDISEVKKYRQLLELVGSDASDPWDYLAKECSLSQVEATLVCDPSTNYKFHLWIINILERGLGLPESDDRCYPTGNYADGEGKHTYYRVGPESDPHGSIGRPKNYTSAELLAFLDTRLVSVNR
jgi:hypothetical protein